MTFDALWRKVCDKNPAILSGGHVTMPLTGFHKAMQLAYNMGRKQERRLRPSDIPSSDMPDFMKGLWK